MSYIFKKGDIVRVKKVVGDDPSLIRENQIVESVKKIDATDIDTYQVDLVGSPYFFTNHELELVNSAVTYPDSSEKSNILKVEDDIIDANLVEPEEVNKPSVDYIKNSHVSENQKKSISEMKRIMMIFQNSQAVIRPHFILTGPSGSGKSNSIQVLCEDLDIPFIEINAAQLTKEGTAGNSLSKALSALSSSSGKPTICFVDEFDKLFISGNNNSSLAHETTNGVQNEFLKVLESEKATVAGDYGKYLDIPIKNVLFIFAGAFNGEENISIERLRKFGIKTEFLGRVGLVYNLHKLTLEDMYSILEKSVLLENYLKVFPASNKEKAIEVIKKYIEKIFEKNTLGARIVNTLVNQYFIKGGKLGESDVEKVSFQQMVDEF